MSKSEIKFFLSRFVSKYKLRRALRELAYGLITLLVMSISLTELSARNVIPIDEAADKNPDSIEACDKQKNSAPEPIYAKRTRRMITSSSMGQKDLYSETELLPCTHQLR